MAIVLDKSHRWRVVLAHVFLICLVLVVIFPFLMILSISLRPGNFAAGSLIPEPSASSTGSSRSASRTPRRTGALVKPDFPVLLWLWNSVKVARLTAIVTLFLSTTAAYAFARMKFRGKQASLAGLMLMQMFPSVLALVAIYAIFDRIGNVFPTFGIDSHWSLLLAYSGGIALHVWTIKGYFDTIPVEIEEAAKVDGATPWQAFRPGAAADGGAHPDGGVPARVHRGHHRVPGGLHPAARGSQAHARRRLQALPSTSRSTCGATSRPRPSCRACPSRSSSSWRRNG